MSGVRKFEWTVRDGNGDTWEWCDETTARSILCSQRLSGPEHGPYTLVRRTWIGMDEDVIA